MKDQDHWGFCWIFVAEKNSGQLFQFRLDELMMFLVCKL